MKITDIKNHELLNKLKDNSYDKLIELTAPLKEDYEQPALLMFGFDETYDNRPLKLVLVPACIGYKCEGCKPTILSISMGDLEFHIDCWTNDNNIEGHEYEFTETSKDSDDYDLGGNLFMSEIKDIEDLENAIDKMLGLPSNTNPKKLN